MPTIYIKDYDTEVDIPEGSDMVAVQAALQKQFPAKKQEQAPKPSLEAPAWAGKYPNLYGVAGAAREALGPVLEALGVGGGAVIGSQGGINPMGGVAGAGLGYAGAKNLLESADVALGNRPGKTLKQQVHELPGEIATGEAMEFGGQVGGKAITKGIELGKYAWETPKRLLAHAYQKALKTPVANEGQILEQMSGLKMTPAQITGDKFLTGAEAIARQHPQTAQQVFEHDYKVAQQAINRLEGIADKLAPGIQGSISTGKAIQTATDETVKTLIKLRRTQATVDYGTVNTLAKGGPIIPTTRTRAELTKIIDEMHTPGNLDSGIIKQAKRILAALNTNKEGTLVIDSAMNLRSKLAEASRGTGNLFKDLNTAKDRIIANRLRRAFEADVENIPTSWSGPSSAVEAWKTANKNYKLNSEAISSIETSVLGKVLGKDVADELTGLTYNTIAPEKIAGQIYNMHPSELTVVKDILSKSHPEAWASIKRMFIENALQAGKKDLGLTVMPLSAAKTVSSMPSKDVSRVLYSPKERIEIEVIKKALVRIGDRSGANTSNTAVWNNFLGWVKSWATPTGLTNRALEKMSVRDIADAMTKDDGRKALLNVLNGVQRDVNGTYKMKNDVDPTKYANSMKALITSMSLSMEEPNE